MKDFAMVDGGRNLDNLKTCLPRSDHSLQFRLTNERASCTKLEGSGAAEVGGRVGAAC